MFISIYIYTATLQPYWIKSSVSIKRRTDIRFVYIIRLFNTQKDEIFLDQQIDVGIFIVHVSVYS